MEVSKMKERSYRRALILATLGAVVTLFSAQLASAQGPGTKTLDSVAAKRAAAAPIEKTVSEKGAESSSPADEKRSSSSLQPATTEVGTAPETGKVHSAAKSGEAKSKNAILWARSAS